MTFDFSRCVLGVVVCSGLLSCKFDTSSAIPDSDGGVVNPDARIPDADTVEDDGGTPDSRPPDASIDPDADLPSCDFDDATLCNIGLPDGAFEIAESIVLDTSLGQEPFCRDFTQNGQEVCLIYSTSFSITGSGYLRVIGTRPLLILSDADIDIQGVVDLASKNIPGGRVGAGANASVCTAPTEAVGSFGGSGGGAGGSFLGAGGNGGLGDMDGSSGNGTSAGSTASSVVAIPAGLRGGCPGSNGASEGSEQGDGVGGNSGDSGGAVSFVALQTFTLGMNAGIRATGSGGRGGGAQSGGGGGGSGGMIYVDATNVIIDGVLLAEGGGGGEGGIRFGNGAVAPGNDGQDSSFSEFGFGGFGGFGGSMAGGNGGDSDGTIPSEVDGQDGIASNGGAGGGGGGGGYIVIRGNLTGTGVNSSSPQIISNP